MNFHDIAIWFDNVPSANFDQTSLFFLELTQEWAAMKIDSTVQWTVRGEKRQLETHRNSPIKFNKLLLAWN